MKPDSYLRDKWNILDISIVLTGWIQNIVIKLNVLRILRILRPLRNISSIRGIKVIFLALIKAAKPLVGTLGTLFFFILVFAIAGLETMMNFLYYQCMELSTGIYEELSCGVEHCPHNMECVYSLENPHFGFTNFDNIFSAMLIVFECVTLQTWVPLMNIAQKTISFSVIVYFIPISFVGAFLILNLSLAVIKSAFTKSMEKLNAKKKDKEQEENTLEHFIDSTPKIIKTLKLMNDDAFEIDSNNITKLKFQEFQDQVSSDRSVISEFKFRPRSSVIRYSVIKNNFDQSDEQPDVPSFKSFQKERTIEKSKKRRESTLKNPKNIEDPIKKVTNTANSPWSYQLKQKFSAIKTNMNGEPNSDLLGIGKGIYHKEFNPEPLDYQEENDKGSIYFLSKFRKSIKIKKGLIKKMKKGYDLEKIKFALIENYYDSYQSKDDVIPPLQGFDKIYPENSKLKYIFTYKGVNCEKEDEIEKN